MKDPNPDAVIRVEIQGTEPEGRNGFSGKNAGLCVPVVRKETRKI